MVALGKEMKSAQIVQFIRELKRQFNGKPDICDHRLKKTRHPVRSAISKLQIARLVL